MESAQNRKRGYKRCSLPFLSAGWGPRALLLSIFRSRVFGQNDENCGQDYNEQITQNSEYKLGVHALHRARHVPVYNSP